MNPSDLFTGIGPYRRALVEDPDGLRTTTSCAAAPVVYGPGETAYNGAEKTLGDAGRRRYPRIITVTLATSTDDYSLSPWTVTGLVGGVETTEELTPATNDGNEVMRTVNAYDIPEEVTISIPAQPNTDGSYTIGVSDIVAPPEHVFRQIVCNVAGDVVMQGTDGKTELQPMVAQQYLPTEAKRILGAGTTADVTVWG